MYSEYIPFPPKGANLFGSLKSTDTISSRKRALFLLRILSQHICVNLLTNTLFMKYNYSKNSSTIYFSCKWPSDLIIFFGHRVKCSLKCRNDEKKLKSKSEKKKTRTEKRKKLKREFISANLATCFPLSAILGHHWAFLSLKQHKTSPFMITSTLPGTGCFLMKNLDPHIFTV